MKDHMEYTASIAGQTLYGQIWEVEQAKAALILLHGMGEHSGRYSGTFVETMNKAGFNVLSIDLFGHGLSEGKRGACPSYESIYDIIDSLIARKETCWPELPFFLFGHSYGGNVLLSYTHRTDGPQSPSSYLGNILSAPMIELGFKPAAWKLFMGNLMYKIYPKWSEKSGLDTEAISSLESACEAYRQDPLIHDVVTAGMMVPALKAGQDMLSESFSYKVPTFMYHGDADRLTSYEASKQFADAHSDHVNFLSVENGYHEIHQDAMAQDVLASVIDWMKSKLN
ncbi:MAG TPA: alpha/beta hydrolase [Bacteroidetes bacterium]|nr:alpha/beta hydrolase [Bacteroidota bacterium]